MLIDYIGCKNINNVFFITYFFCINNFRAFLFVKKKIIFSQPDISFRKK